jgi:hypothetical protein
MVWVSQFITIFYASIGHTSTYLRNFLVEKSMSSRHQDFLSQYYGEGPQQASDFESKPKKKKVVRAVAKPLQGLKVIDDYDSNADFEDFTPITLFKATTLVLNCSFQFYPSTTISNCHFANFQF